MTKKKLIIIIIIIIIILVITIMQGIYNYIPETNHVYRVYSVGAVMYLQFVLHVVLLHPLKYILYFYISTFRSMNAPPNMAVLCSSLIPCFPGMLLSYCLSDFEIVPVAPLITAIAFAFTFHMR
jgi:membrane protein YdbS with pleckstrin-like domain